MVIDVIILTLISIGWACILTDFLSSMNILHLCKPCCGAWLGLILGSIFLPFSPMVFVPSAVAYIFIKILETNLL